MRIITWNCQGAFRNKLDAVAHYAADILIVQECESLEKFQKNSYQYFKNATWYGENTSKGIGVFSNTYSFEILDIHNTDFKTIIPISATNGAIAYTLFAICAINTTTPKEKYIEQVWKAIHYYTSLLTNKNVILAGDFNSNAIWDRTSSIGNHSDVVAKLASYNIHSAYHVFFQQAQGQEMHPTFFHYRKKEKPFHLDYCFLSNNLLNKIKSVHIGDYKTWTAFSDHSPIIIDL
jgi:exodeoxyribonuclease III